jgi:hypothetical protein
LTGVPGWHPHVADDSLHGPRRFADRRPDRAVRDVARPISQKQALFERFNSKWPGVPAHPDAADMVSPARWSGGTKSQPLCWKGHSLFSTVDRWRDRISKFKFALTLNQRMDGGSDSGRR